jgi:hypothetical protein
VSTHGGRGGASATSGSAMSCVSVRSLVRKAGRAMYCLSRWHRVAPSTLEPEGKCHESNVREP